nr:hypothetical protein [uncultured Photobacterium sp.]
MTQEQILHDQFNALEREIQRLRQQQKAIVMLLKQPSLLEQNMVTKERCVEIYKITNHAPLWGRMLVSILR